MKNQKELIISADTVELSHLPSDSPLTVSIGENTLVVTPQRMTAIQAANTITALTAFTSTSSVPSRAPAAPARI